MDLLGPHLQPSAGVSLVCFASELYSHLVCFSLSLLFLTSPVSRLLSPLTWYHSSLFLSLSPRRVPSPHSRWRELES